MVNSHVWQSYKDDNPISIVLITTEKKFFF